MPTAAFAYDRRALDRYVKDADSVSNTLQAAWAALAAASKDFAAYHWYTCRPGASEDEMITSIRSTGYLSGAPKALPWSLIAADDSGGPLDGDWALVLEAAGGAPTSLLVVGDGYQYDVVTPKQKRWLKPAVSWTPVPMPSIPEGSPWARLWGPGAWRDWNTWTGVFAPDDLARVAFRATPMMVREWAAFIAFARVADRGECPPPGSLVVNPAADSWLAADCFGAVVGAGLVRTWSAKANGWHTSRWEDLPKLRPVLPVVFGREA